MTNPRPTSASRDMTRRLLATIPAPLAPHAVVTTFTAQVGDAVLKLQYVPDRVLLTQEGFEQYIAARSATENNPLEALTSLIADDVANELVPKWSRVTLTRLGKVMQTVTAEDRQPGWNHPTLLSGI